MTDNEIIYAYFKARFNLKENEVIPIYSSYSILESFPDFKREVLEVMEGEGYFLILDKRRALWIAKENYDVAIDEVFWNTIKDNEILRAAVIAATRYFKDKKK